MSETETLLNGIIDIHIHTNPDVRGRRLSDLQLAAEARRVGARAIVIKSHLVTTMDRASIAREAVPGIEVFGGIVLNPHVGGLNAVAVDTAIKLGAKIVWLPNTSEEMTWALPSSTMPIWVAGEPADRISVFFG